MFPLHHKVPIIYCKFKLTQCHVPIAPQSTDDLLQV